MIEVSVILVGVIFFAWLYALVRQTQQGARGEQSTPLRPIVPVNLMSSDEAVVVSEGRGRIVYINEPGRRWFDLDGGAPNLAAIVRHVQPADTVHDLLASPGHASFRLGQRQIEAVSHAIPGTGGQRMVIVMRELTASALPIASDFDPLRALAILSDISQAVGSKLDLDATIDAVLRSIEQSITFQTAEITLWYPDTQTLRPVGRSVSRTPTGRLMLTERPSETVYRIGEGYTGWLAMYRQPLLIGDVGERTDIVPKLAQSDLQSYLGVPLVIGDEFIGTLELMRRERHSFSQRDVTLLTAVSGQVAAGVQAARLYREQMRQLDELEGLQQIAGVMSHLGSPHELYAGITERIADLMDVELAGVLLYDEDEQVFRSQPPFHGVPDTLIRQYRLSVVPNTDLYNIWYHQPWWYTNDPRSPLIDAMGFEEVRTAITVRSMALAPMIAGTRRVGLLLVGNRRGSGGFDEDGMRTLIAFAAQAAVVTENARLYEDEQRRARELGGLQQIAQAMGVVRSPAELYSQITARIASLLDVTMCGILLYDPKERVLVSQHPFYGLEDEEALRFYQIPSAPGGPVARLWQERDTWFSNNLSDDLAARGTDLSTLAAEVGMRQTVIATLVVGGNRLGVVQAANRADGSDFTEDDARLLSIFAGQAAVLIDNARLYREMQHRTHEAEGLRAVTEIASKAVPDDETVEFVLVAIANLLDTQVVAIGLVDESTGQLVVEPNKVWGHTLRDPYHIDAYASGFENSVLVSRRSHVSPDVRADERVLPAYKGLIDQLGLRSWIQVPLVIQERSIGELTVANRQSGEAFTDSDTQLLTSIATQVAAMLDRMRLHQATDQDLRARVQELNALGRVSHELSRTLELDRILDVIRQEALRSTDADAVSIVLLSERDDWEAPDQPGISRRFGEGRTLRGLAPLERAAVLRNDVIMVDDYVGGDFEARPQNARSALVVPVTYGEQVIGLIHLYSVKPGIFSQGVVDFVVSLTDQATVAIANARRYENQLQLNRTLRVRAERMGRIFELGELFRQGASLPELLEEVAHGIQETIGFNVVLVSLVDERAGVLRRTAQAGLPLAVFEEMQRTAPPLEQAEGLMLEQFTVSNSYFLPAERSEALTDGLPVYQILQERMGAGPRAWDPDDLLLVPLYGAGGSLLGLISVDEPRSGRRPDQNTVEALEIFANQAAFSIENFRLVERIRQEAEATRRERDRLAQLHLVASEIQSAPDVPSRLQVVADGIHTAGWGHVVITLRDERLEPTALIQSGYTPDEALRLSDNVIAGDVWRAWINDLQFHEHKLGAGYYLRYTSPWVRKHLLKDKPIEPPSVPDDEWHPLDVIYLPLIGQDQHRIIGIIAMDSPVDGRAPTEASLQPFELFASQAAAAIETTRLYQETVRAAEQEQRLNEMMEAVSAAISPAAVIEAVGRGLQQIVPFTRMSVALFQDAASEFEVLRADIALDTSVTVHQDAPLPGQGTATAEIYRGGQARLYQLSREAKTRQSVPDLSAWYAGGERSTLLVPMSAAGQGIGVLRLGSELENAFGFQENLDLIQRLANLSAVALENARLFQEAQDRAAALDVQAGRLALINRVSTRLAQTLDPQEIYTIVLGELVDILKVQVGGLVLFENETQGRLVLSYPFDQPTPDLMLDLVDNRSIEIVRETHQPLISTDVLSDPLFEVVWPQLRQRGTKSLIIVPLVVGEQVIGTIGLDATEQRIFAEAEVELVQTIASQASLAVEKARLYNETLGLTIFNQAVVESIQQGIVVLDRDLVVQRINRFMMERYGWSPAAVGAPLFDYRPDYGAFLRESIAVALGMGEPQMRYEVERRDEAGERSIRNYYVYPMLEARQVTGIVLLLEDVTERARLEADLEQRAAQMSALSEVSSQITATLEPDQVVNLVLDALDRVIAYDGVSLWLRAADREELAVVAARGYDDPNALKASELVGMTVEISDSRLFREMAENARVINVGDVSAGDPRFPGGSAAVYKNWLGAPLISKGNVVGVMALEKREPNFYTALHEQLTLTFANQAAVALDNAQLFQETRARAIELDDQAQRLALLNRVSLALAQTLDLENIYEIALRETSIALGVAEGAALQIDSERGLATVIVEYPRGDAPPQAVYDVAQNSAIERVLSGLIPLVVEQGRNNPIAAGVRAMLRRPDVDSSLMVPLVVGGDVIGVLRLDALSTNREFMPEQIELAQTIASQAAIAVQNASLFEQTSIRTRELETLFESAQATAVTLDLDEVVRRVTVQMLGAVGADACAVFLWDDVNNQLELRGEISARPADVPAGTIGTFSGLADFPLRERALRERELITVRAEDPDLPPGERDLMVLHQAASRLLIPLVVNEISIGMVEVETLDPRRVFRAETLRLARTLASQAAISIENARLQTETRRTVEELYIINEMSGALSSANSLDGLLAVIDAQLPSLTDAEVLYVALYDAETQQLTFPLATHVHDDRPLNLPSHPLGKDEFSLVVRQKAPLLLAGENVEQVRRSLGIETIMPEARCFLGVPLFAGEELVGVLAVRDDRDFAAFSHNDQRILNTVGAQLGVAVQSTRLFQQTLQLAADLERRVSERTAELEQERQYISTLYAITTELATSLDMDRLLRRALEMVAGAVGATQGAILAVDPISERLYFRARLGWQDDEIDLNDSESSLATNEGLAGWAIQNRRSVIVADVQNDPRWLRLGVEDDAPHAAMVALIESNEDILGVTMLYSATPGAFSEDDLRLVTAASSQVADAMNNAELYSLIRDQAERLGAMLRQEQVEATKSAAILDSVADGVMVADSNGEVIVFNTTAAGILGVPVENVLHHSTSEITGLYGAGQTRWAAAVESWMRDPTVHQPGEFLEERITLETGHVISVRVSPVSMGDQFLGTVSIFRDITREVEVDRLKSEFVATVSHELRTPMTSIKGYADLLLLGAAGPMSEQQQRFLETIKQNADRLSVLVNDLLDISRIDQGRIELNFGPVEVEDVLNATSLHLRTRADELHRPMNIITLLPEDRRLTVWGDYDKVAQILANLADNAFNYTPSGGDITLAAEANDATGRVIFRVTDTGIGIPPEAAERVFERFFRGDEYHELVMDTPGTGLGLAIVRELVQAHHGQIWFESEVGQGTTFYVELPVQPVTEDEHTGQ